VQLEVAVEGAAGAAGLRDPVGVAADPAQGVRLPKAFLFPVELPRLDEAGGHAAPEEAAPEGRFLGRPDDHLERVAGADPALGQGGDHLQGGHGAEGAVEVAAPPDGVDVGAEEDGREAGVLARPEPHEVACGIDARSEAERLHLLENVTAASHVGLREGSAAHPVREGASRRPAEDAQLLEPSPEPCRVHPRLRFPG
jgi:hypothetical protein